MDQVSPPPRSLERSTASGPPSDVDASPSCAEAAPDPGEDPYSPGSRDPLAVDPLAEPLGVLLGAVLALLTLAVPLLGVLNDRRDEPASTRLPVPSAQADVPAGMLRP